MTTHTVNSTKTVAVSVVQEWLPIDKDTPRGTKMLVIRKGAGSASISEVHTNEGFWTHWAPLPRWPKET